MMLISFYLLRGHKLEDLLNLSITERNFYIATMELEIERTAGSLK